MDRRTFLRRGLAAAAGAGLLTRSESASAASAQPGAGPYGSIEGRTPDINGFLLPEGFTSRVVAVSGDPVGDTDHWWHLFPSAAATFPDGEGGWYLTSNSDIPNYLTPDEAWGGASSIHFDNDGSIIGAYPVLAWSHSNAGGAPTPWGTWLSCEADFFGAGRIWECDPSGAQLPQAREAMGLRNHGGAAVDPVGETVYLTEDHRFGRLYRYTPEAWPDLSSGTLEAMAVAGDDSVSWREVADPSEAIDPARRQVSDAFTTPAGKGCWYHEGWVFFATQFDNRVHAVELAAGRHELLWDGFGGRRPLTGIDDLTVDRWTGDLYVAETAGDLELVIVSTEGEVAPFCRIADPAHELSAVTGPCFDPAGRRLYLSSQRGPGNRLVRDIIPAIDWGDGPPGRMGGVTYEITGPFRGRPTTAPTTTTTAPVTTITPTKPSLPVTTTAVPTTAVATSTAPPATTRMPATVAPTTTAVSTTAVATSTVPPATTTLARAAGESTSAADDRGSDWVAGVGVAAVAALAVGTLVMRRRSSGAGSGNDRDSSGREPDEAP